MRLTARRLRSSRLALGGLRETGDPRRTGASYSTGLPVRSPGNQGRPGPSTSRIIDRVLRQRRSGLAAGCGRPAVAGTAGSGDPRRTGGSRETCGRRDGTRAEREVVAKDPILLSVLG